MGDKSLIDYVDASWSPIRGCTPVSAGCLHCWATRDAIRRAKPGQQCHGLVKSTSHGPTWTGEVRLIERDLDAPLRWRAPRRIAVCFGGDLFHEKVSNDTIAKVFGVMQAARRHTFLVLTKRAERLRDWMRWIMDVGDGPPNPWPLPNVWLGVSVEGQPTADQRIPLLLQTPAAARWVSYEPALAAVDFAKWLEPCSYYCDHEQPYPQGHHSERSALSWLVLGGESGPGARPFDLAWARAAIAQCRAAGCRVFFKQAGARPLLDGMPLSLRDRKGSDLIELPTEFHVREFPDA